MPGYSGRERRRDGREWNGPERRIASSGASQLLEEGDIPSGPAGSHEDNVNEFTSDGGRARQSTGATSGARGHEGLDFPDENTWGEEAAERERKE